MARKKSHGKKAADAQKGVAPAKGAEKQKASPKPKASKAKAEAEPGKIAQFAEFFEQSKVEIKKVTWPTRKETVTTSIAVLVLTLVMAVFLGIVDLGLTKAIEAILS